MNSLPLSSSPPVQEQSETTAPSITPITPMLGIILPPEITTACLICLSLFLLSALHSPLPPVHKPVLYCPFTPWLCSVILPLLPDFSAFTFSAMTVNVTMLLSIS